MAARKTTTGKTSATEAAKPAAKAPRAKAAAPQVDGGGDAAETGGAGAAGLASGADATVMLRKKELLARIAESSGLRPNKIKPVMEAVLREIGDALERGEALNVPPLGKLSVNRTKEGENANVIVAKLRRSKAMLKADEEARISGGEGLAGAAE